MNHQTKRYEKVRRVPSPGASVPRELDASPSHHVDVFITPEISYIAIKG